MTDKQPIYILPENIERTMGRDAQRNNILAAKLVADSVKTTLGPKGMEKMLVNAKRIGMKTIHFIDSMQLKEELEKYGVML